MSRTRTPRTAARPSMADVGRLAQVSAQTVSRYYSGEGYVSEATRARIAAAIEELGYRPNRAAGSLRARRTGTIGALSVGEMNYGSAQILAGLSSAARDAGRTLMIDVVPLEYDATGWREEVRRTLDHFLSAPVDGIIVSTAVAGVGQEIVERHPDVPLVNLSERHGSSGTGRPGPSTVGIMATQHLIDLGHERIVHVAGPATRTEAADREAGYRAAMEAAGLEPQVITGATSWWADSGAVAAQSLRDGDVTAVFAANDELALGVMSALEARGLRAPRDYAIVGVDDMPAAAFFSPPLTTVAIDFEGIGRAAFTAMGHLLEQGEDAPDVLADITPRLVVRGSTAPPHDIA